MSLEQLLFDKKVNCPVCNGEFQTKMVKISACRLDRKDEDFCPHYKDIIPMAYDIWVCPFCGYAAFLNHFHSISHSNSKLVRQYLHGKWVEKDFGNVRTVGDAIQCYMLTLMESGIVNSKSSHKGNICIKIAWLYRIVRNTSGENKYLKFALDNYQEAFNNEKVYDGSLNEVSLCYLIGELFRRLGQPGEAIKWFSNVISNPAINSYPTIENLTRKQWQIAREEYKERGLDANENVLG